ncbi:MAG: glycoside hydrolase family 2 TIM barrel-domain containing protein, partial [bacterium]|nr:glycoside hydrolase family 2 TIM barrel-domain containing protein [bacterium]
TLASIAKGTQEVEQLIPIPNPRLWSLDDPFLYEVTVSVRGNPMIEDRVSTYFGMRKVSVVNLPGTEFPYVALNNKPVYMQLTLDQAYHPDGFYTFPTDAFTRDEILRSKSIGLNGMRVHIKVPLTRKLYWADKLGMLIMADLPNSWGAPDADARQESEYTLKAMIERDFNHPSIFSWITFNETWGLKTDNKYLPETQKWVGEMVTLAKTLDPTRLVEDNSACNYDHVTPTDLNTWHAYLPGYEWMDFLANACNNTYEGSTWNFAEGYKQGKQPMFNSECGNVWGYEGSAGDVDWSWDYHLMMNAFRRFPQCAGWLYTEHHDVINEWNGYWRYDRSEKYTGMEELAPGMTLNDLHGAFYLALSEELCQDVKPGDTVKVPVFASFMSDRPASNLQIQWTLRGWTRLGETAWYDRGSREVPYTPWMNKALEPITVQMPQTPGLAILTVALVDGTQTVLHRNFTTFVVKDGAAPRDEKIHVDGKNLRVLRVAPQQFNDAKWSLKQWNVLDGLKVNGAGSGYFEYRIPWPDNLDSNAIAQATFRMEASAKQLFGKDQENATKQEGDFMLGGGTHDPSRNPNAYPMTDEEKFPSLVRVRAMGELAGSFELSDDSADHRGILSWHAQPRDKKLREAGSFGYLISAALTPEMLQKAKEQKELVIRLEVDAALPGGLAIYGENFGRYPLDPSIIFVMK